MKILSASANPNPGLMDTRSEGTLNIRKLSRSLIDAEDRYSDTVIDLIGRYVQCSVFDR